MMCKGNKS